jgi:tRNA threonylcarbamoyladenosine biosynthesis protein TsaB
MKVLALETATEACSAALSIEGEVRERFQIAPQGHSQLLLPMMDELLAEAGIAVSQLDGLAFGRGPGAFTGVRIGVGVAQGIAYSADLPVAPVSTLAALAQGVDSTRVIAALDARMGEVYWGAYERSAHGLVQLRTEECVCAPDKAPLLEDEAWVGAGSGWKAYAEILNQVYKDSVMHCLESELPHAAAVAMLGEEAIKCGETVSAEKALPVYLRDEVTWKKIR